MAPNIMKSLIERERLMELSISQMEEKLMCDTTNLSFDRVLMSPNTFDIPSILDLRKRVKSLKCMIQSFSTLEPTTTDDTFMLISLIKATINRIKSCGEKEHKDLVAREYTIAKEIETLERYEDEPLQNRLTNCISSKKMALSLNNSIVTPPVLHSGLFCHSWHPSDHQIFLNLFKRQERKIIDIKSVLPHMSELDIVCHKSRYESYLQKSEATKRELRKWRAKKTEEKSKIESKEQAEDFCVPKCKTGIVNPKRKDPGSQIWKNKKESLRNNEKDVTVEPKLTGYTQHERKDIKMKLERYFTEKERISIERKGIEKTFKELSNYGGPSMRCMEEFQKRDKELIERKIEQIGVKNENETSQNIKSKRIVPTGNFRKPTTTFLARIATKEQAKNCPMSIDFIPHKMKASWRQNV